MSITRADLGDASLVVEALTNVSDTAIDAALTSAWEEAEGYLRTAEYGLPLPAESVTTTLKRKACALAEWELFGRGGLDPTSGANELLRLRYEDAVSWWEKVAAGKVQPIPRTAEGLSNDATPTVEETPTGAAAGGASRGWSTDYV